MTKGILLPTMFVYITFLDLQLFMSSKREQLDAKFLSHLVQFYFKIKHDQVIRKFEFQAKWKMERVNKKLEMRPCKEHGNWFGDGFVRLGKCNWVKYAEKENCIPHTFFWNPKTFMEVYFIFGDPNKVLVGRLRSWWVECGLEVGAMSLC